jgi:hypothetical protein
VLLSDRLAEVMAHSGGGGSTPPRPAQLLVPATLVGLGHEQLAQGDSAAAAGLARRALAAAPRCRPAWLLLARAFIAARQFAAALVALNVMPNPPLPVSDAELLHVVVPPAPKHVTHPQVSVLLLLLGQLFWGGGLVCALTTSLLSTTQLLVLSVCCACMSPPARTTGVRVRRRGGGGTQEDGRGRLA